jgi:CysZ protein
MLAIQYVDYSYDNHQISFKQLKKDLKSDRLTALGFGTATTLMSMIPLLNLIAIPAAVCGGTVFYLERLQTKISYKKGIKCNLA